MTGPQPTETRAALMQRMGRSGFGAAPLGNMNRILAEAEAEAILAAAWETGARYFDTAPLYGHGLSEQRLGRALAARPRGSFVLSTKVGRLLDPCAEGQQDSGIYLGTPPFSVTFDYSRAGVMRSFEESCIRLGGIRPDILFVHDLDPVTHAPAAHDRHWRALLDGGGWQALEELRRCGDIAAIGAGLNQPEPAERFVREAGADIILIAGRHTLLDQSASQSLLPACLERGVVVVAGGPFNSGILATGPVPGARHDYREAPAEVLARVAAIAACCTRHSVPLPRAALHFARNHPAIAAIITGGQSVLEVEQNAAALAQDVTAALWRELAGAGLVPEPISARTEPAPC